jgi:hypothetical protein
MLLDIAIAIGNKILPEVIKRFFPLVKIQPKELNFIKSDWKTNFSFFLYNRANYVLFDVYLLIKTGHAQSEDFEILKTGKYPELKTPCMQGVNVA